jgi:hypothetical protein
MTKPSVVTVHPLGTTLSGTDITLTGIKLEARTMAGAARRLAAPRIRPRRDVSTIAVYAPTFLYP